MRALRTKKMNKPWLHSTMRATAIGAVALVAAGCAGGKARPEAAVAPAPGGALPGAAVVGTVGAVGATPGPERAPLAAQAEAARQPTLVIGNDRQVKLPPARPVTVSAGGDVSLKFDQAPVTEVVHAVLGDLLKLDYSIQQPLAGDITLYTQAPIPRAQVLSMLDTVLQANGLVLAQDSQGVFHVGSPEALKGIGEEPRRVGALAAGKNVVIVPLRYIGATELAEILKPIAPPEALLRVDSLRNLLVLAGRRSQIDNWLEFVDIFDVDLLKGMSVGLFPLEHISVQEVEAALRLMTGGEAVAPESAPRPADGKEGKGGQAAAQPRPLPLAGPFGGLVRILPIERMNAVVIVTPRAHYLDVAREWIARLDRPHDGGSEPQLYVYPVQNGTAEHLAGLLNAIFGGTVQEAAAPAGDSGVAPGLSSGWLRAGLPAASGGGSGFGSLGSGTGFTTGFGTGASPVLGGMGGADQQQGPRISQVTLGERVRVVADDYNNALLIYAPKSEYTKIESALRRLDVAPTQVLIEASILEVTLTDETRFGLQWFLEGSLGGGWRGHALLTTNGDSATIGRDVPGFSYTITNPAGAVRAVLNALAEKSLLNVISTPSVMVLDNQTAAIHVGDQQPIRSAQTVTDGGTTISSIQYKDTGVVLSVTPSVNAGNMVSMVIRQSVTDVGQVDSATGQRAFLQREVQSRVAVRSGETLVMGGLIRENHSRDRQGVPVLHDIPVIGNLFGTTARSTARTELLVMITPRVVRGDQDLRELGSEIRRRMQGLRIVPGWDAFERPPTRQPAPADAQQDGGGAEEPSAPRSAP